MQTWKGICFYLCSCFPAPGCILKCFVISQMSTVCLKWWNICPGWNQYFQTLSQAQLRLDLPQAHAVDKNSAQWFYYSGQTVDIWEINTIQMQSPGQLLEDNVWTFCSATGGALGVPMWGFISTEFFANIHGSQRMNDTYFDDLLTFNFLPPSRWHMRFKVRGLNH